METLMEESKRLNKEAFVFTNVKLRDKECRYCGNLNKEQARYCTYCGIKLEF